MKGIYMKRLFKDYIFPYLMITVGAGLAAFAIEEFLIPSTILDGGITGISMILDKITPLQMSVFIIMLNLPFLIIGFKQLGRAFFIRGIYGMILFSVLLEVFHEFANVTETELLAVVFGGILLGAGVGLVLRYGGCLDGTEIIALLISKKTSFSIGQIILGANIIIYMAAGILFGWDRAMYSLLTYFITFKVIDVVEQGMEQAKAIMIITDDGEYMANEIYQKLGRTCTKLEGSGFLSGTKDVLYCVVTRMEISGLKNIVHSSDKSAFVTVSDISEIIGHHIKRNDISIKENTNSDVCNAIDTDTEDIISI
ncbi:MAG: YitT family protein [Clostridia bacterium]|nr:YitT family protein [Clostridia bacterium]